MCQIICRTTELHTVTFVRGVHCFVKAQYKETRTFSRKILMKFKKADLRTVNRWVSPLRSTYAIWRHRTGSTLARVLACCRTAPYHYLNQSWLIIMKVQLPSCEKKFTRGTPLLIAKITYAITHLKFFKIWIIWCANRDKNIGLWNNKKMFHIVPFILIKNWRYSYLQFSITISTSILASYDAKFVPSECHHLITGNTTVCQQLDQVHKSELLALCEGIHGRLIPATNVSKTESVFMTWYYLLRPIITRRWPKTPSRVLWFLLWEVHPRENWLCYNSTILYLPLMIKCFVISLLFWMISEQLSSNL